MKHKGKVEKGKLIFFNPILRQTYINCLEGKHFVEILKIASKPRNLPQNARHWARMTFAANALGDRTPEELHYDFCSYFLTDRTTTPPRVKGSSELTIKDFSEWEENIDRVLAEMEIVIPEPEDEK